MRHRLPSEITLPPKVEAVLPSCSSAAIPNNGVIDPSYLNGMTGFSMSGVDAGDALGTAVTTGDITGDGLPDIAISAPGASPNDGVQGGGAGSVYIIYGKKTGWFSSVDLSGL
jgi:FG-GAP repeat